MKKLITMVAVAAFAGLLCVGTTRAQGAESMLVSIPFDFAFSDIRLPAGDYYVRRGIEGSRVVVQIRAKEKPRNAYLPVHSLVGAEIQSESKLVFKRYGNHYFLAEIWIAGRQDGEELTTGKKERELIREMGEPVRKPEIIAINGKPN